MKILIVHNRYLQYGGEDAVFQAEAELMISHGHFVERVVFEGREIKTFFSKCRAALGIFYNIDSARKIRKRIENFGPDIIHVHNFFPFVSPSIFFVAKRYNVPVILTLHNYRLICPSATLYYNRKIYEKSARSIFPLDAIFKGVYHHSTLQTALIAMVTALHHLIGTWQNRIDRYIVLTQFSLAKFRSSALRIPEDRFIVKSNFVTDSGMGERERKDFFLFAGRLTEEKGVHTLLRAACLYNFKLTIAGDGPLRSTVEEYAETHPNICYLGFQERQRIINLLKNCKALIFPSIWYEGLPMTILEAFSAGTPVIASKLGGMAEVVVNHINGLHFEAGNEEDLVSKIEEIINDPEGARALSENARNTYLKYYTPERNYPLLSSIYYQAIEEKAVMNHMVAPVT